MARKQAEMTFTARVLGWKELANAAKLGATEITRLGSSAQTAGRKASESSRGWGIFARQAQATRKHADHAAFSVGGLVKGLGALGVGYAALSGARDAIDTTKSLGEETLLLGKNLGYTGRQAADTAAMLKVRNVSTQSFAAGVGVLSRQLRNSAQQQTAYNMSLTKAGDVSQKVQTIRTRENDQLSLLGVSARDAIRRVQIESNASHQIHQIQVSAMQRTKALVAKGPGTAAAALTSLGIDPKQAKNMPAFQLIGRLANAFNSYRGGLTKVQLATQLFGRSAQRVMLPLFKEGPLGYFQTLKQADKMVGPFFKGGIKSTEDFLAAQQQAQFATMGVQIALGKFLIPMVSKLDTAWSHLVTAIHSGAGPWGVIKGAIGAVVWPIKQVVGFLEHSKTAAQALGGVLVGLGAAWGVEKIIGAYNALKKFWAITHVLVPLVKGLRNVLWGESAAETALAGTTAATTAAERAQATTAAADAVAQAAAGGAAGGAGLGALARVGSVVRWLGPLGAAAGAFAAFHKSDGVDWLASLAEGHLKGHVVPYKPKHRVPGLARGGFLRSAGSVMVGEHGPEMLSFPGPGARVSPLGSGNVDDLASRFAEALARYLHIDGSVIMDSKELAESTVQWQLVRTARR